MDTALHQKFPFILDRNLAKASCTEDHVCTSCDKVVLGFCRNFVLSFNHFLLFLSMRVNGIEIYDCVCRFYSLWDTGYAKIHIPIIASVSEHQPTTWFSFFFDLHILIATFPAGLWYCIKDITDERVFSKIPSIS